MFSRMMVGIGLLTVFLTLSVAPGVPSSYAAQRDIPAADNLAEIGRLSRQQAIPIIIFVSRDACPYCRTLHDEILEPMLAADKFEHRAILAEVSLDRVEAMTGFDNREMTPKVFAEFYRAEITPTLLFLDSAGREIGRRRVGITNLELYGHYLEESIEEALQAIRKKGPGE